MIKRFLALKNFYMLANSLFPLMMVSSLLLLGYSFINGVFFAPIDYQQREAVRIMYLHVPCALLSLSVYAVIGICSAIFLVWKIKLADVIAAASAPIGTCFTALALFTGAMWGKPMWGAYWVWDARLTSELILLFLYFGYLILRKSIYDSYKASFSAAILGLIGLVDLPIIHFSVEWWHTLHQGPSISRFAKPAIATPMLLPLLIAIVGMYFLYFAILLLVARTHILQRERQSVWLQELLYG